MTPKHKFQVTHGGVYFQSDKVTYHHTLSSARKSVHDAPTPWASIHRYNARSGIWDYVEGYSFHSGWKKMVKRK